MKPFLNLIFGIAIGAGGYFAAQMVMSSHNAAQPYAGQDQRLVSSLSADAVKQLEEGAGWGLAKPAEFNGYHGPAHVLEFADELSLTATQLQDIQAEFDSMNAAAREAGTRLIDAEIALDEAFKDGSIDDAVLQARLANSEEGRAELRQIHLSAHLKITPLLSDEQKQRYKELRGYNGGHNAHSGH